MAPSLPSIPDRSVLKSTGLFGGGCWAFRICLTIMPTTIPTAKTKLIITTFLLLGASFPFHVGFLKELKNYLLLRLFSCSYSYPRKSLGRQGVGDTSFTISLWSIFPLFDWKILNIRP